MDEPLVKSSCRAIANDGYYLLRGIFDCAETTAVRAAASAALEAGEEATLRAGDGSVYGARNVIQLWPAAATVWRRPMLLQILGSILGPRFGLVRVLFFDKPPDQTWALPWHPDVTIAVKDNGLPSTLFRRPTAKAGVPHIQPPRSVLDNMLTLRLHLDEVTAENGPLQVLPGSHQEGAGGQSPVAIHADAGDVLALRPLLLHCSHRSHPETRRHRRVLHLEFASTRKLPEGFAWHEFIPGARGPADLAQ